MADLRFRIRAAELSDLARCIELDASYVTTQVWQLQEGFQNPNLAEATEDLDLDSARSVAPKRPPIVGKTETPKPLTYHMELVPSRLPRPMAVPYHFSEQELLAEWKRTDHLLIAETIEEDVSPPPVDKIAPALFAENAENTDLALEPPPAITPDLLGYVGLRVDGPRHLAWITTGAVQLDFRRQAIGSRLLHEALDWADRNRLRSVLVELQTKNYPAISFFQQNKFFFCGYNNSYYPTREIALFFARRLERFIVE